MTEKRIIEEVLDQYAFEGEPVFCGNYGNGHINQTYLLEIRRAEGKSRRMILQKMNREVFQNPVEVMENIIGVTTFLKRKITEAGGDPKRETLNVVRTKSGMPYYLDSSGEYWRIYLFIEEASCYDQVKSINDFYQSALAFGNFQYLLSDYPADTLHETIPGFHDTRQRFENFQKAVERDLCGRVSEVQSEIDFILAREKEASVLCDMLTDGELPLRVTHNDTKLNNIMIDNTTRKGICVIDLDTVMPGLSVNDFGDSIRFGASTAAEDETDLDKVSCSMKLFEAYTKGFMEGCRGRLKKSEIRMLPMGAKIMTYECGMRFLTDYLEGDHYFRIHREKHNLDRARTQLKLVSDMEKKWQEMQRIVFV